MARGDINSSNAGQQQRGGAVGNGTDLETLIIRTLQNKLGLDRPAIQRMQELTGDRQAAGEASRPKAAVKRAALASIRDMKQMKSTRLTGSPTAADYNALRDDLIQVFQVLQAISDAVKTDFDA